MAGFNLPPGCSVSDIPGNGPTPPCEVCGGNPDADNHEQTPCICPECPECGEYGNPNCYEAHGLRRNATQEAQLADQEAKWALGGEAVNVNEAYFGIEGPLPDTTPPEIKALVADSERCIHVLGRAFSAGIKPIRTARHLHEIANKLENYTESWTPPQTRNAS
jgi:hypothetical protein